MNCLEPPKNDIENGDRLYHTLRSFLEGTLLPKCCCDKPNLDDIRQKPPYFTTFYRINDSERRQARSRASELMQSFLHFRGDKARNQKIKEIVRVRKETARNAYRDALIRLGGDIDVCDATAEQEGLFQWSQGGHLRPFLTSNLLMGSGRQLRRITLLDTTRTTPDRIMLIDGLGREYREFENKVLMTLDSKFVPNLPMVHHFESSDAGFSILINELSDANPEFAIYIEKLLTKVRQHDPPNYSIIREQCVFLLDQRHWLVKCCTKQHCIQRFTDHFTRLANGPCHSSLETYHLGSATFNR